jgi:hypothetical protein
MIRRWTLRILVHAVSLLTFLPVGWCCWLPTAQAEEQTAAPESCCCCPAKPVKTPSPQIPDDEQPQAPQCCCDPQPAALAESKVSPFEPKSFATFSVVAAALIEPNAVTNVDFLHPPFVLVPSLSLHVFHCVWLC